MEMQGQEKIFFIQNQKLLSEKFKKQYDEMIKEIITRFNSFIFEEKFNVKQTKTGIYDSIIIFYNITIIFQCIYTFSNPNNDYPLTINVCSYSENINEEKALNLISTIYFDNKGNYYLEKPEPGNSYDANELAIHLIRKVYEYLNSNPCEILF